MKLGQRKPSGREKDKASMNFLGQLRENLYSDNVSIARIAAFRLSWMQEDGLDILKEALFSGASRVTERAAAYGLRKMNGRMKKVALEVFKQGLKHHDSTTREVCKKGLSEIEARTTGKSRSQEKKGQVGKFEIREIPSKSRRRATSMRKRVR